MDVKVLKMDAKILEMDAEVEEVVYSREEFEKEYALLQENGLKDSELRHAYEQKVAELAGLPEILQAQGLNEADIARTMHEKRRALGKVYKLASPPLFREYIYAATAAKYGDPLGPTFEMLCQKKSYQQIIASASRPIENLDNRLTLDGFKNWYFEKIQSHN